MEKISKSFPGVKALDNVDFSVNAGEVHALVGENGAGKSTLIKILMGALIKDSGAIFIEGQKIDILNPGQAKQNGLGAVYQDVMLAQHLSVGENFFLGKLPMTAYKTINWKLIYQEASEALENLHIKIDPKKLVKDLTVAQQEMVVIAKTLHENAKVIIFDEPTALLANEETEELFKIIQKLKEKNVGIVYISHRLEEIFRISDRVTVLKDGKHVNTLNTSQTDENSLISMMVGRSAKDMYSIGHTGKTAEIVMEIKGLTKKGVFENISFKLQKGEILGMFGLVGSGRTDIVRCIFGADIFDSGEIWINGKRAFIKSPLDAISKGIGLLPEDRKKQGLCLNLSVETNINLALYPEITAAGIIHSAKEKETAETFRKKIDIRTPSISQKVQNLSGGNQQKVVMAKWLCKHSKIFIFDEPTAGVDVGAKAEIYKLFEKLTIEGNSIIMVSSYLPEIMGVADRAIVISEGKQMGTLLREDYIGMTNEDEEKFLKLASGLKVS
jgi:ribose transport system ATP-binding protein